MAVGLFDSGVGGLTILKEIRKILPEEKIYYVGDSLRVPYGEKDKLTIISYCSEITDFLVKKGVDTIVIACNTATIMAKNELEKKYDKNIIGVINSSIKTAIKMTNNKKIGIIGTNATINSCEHEKKLKEIDQNIEVFSKACPLLVYAIEDGIINGRLLEEIVKMYLDDFANEIDTLILACTHFPIIKDVIVKLYPHIMLVDPSKETAYELKNSLNKNKINSLNIKSQEPNFYVSGNLEKFKEIGERFLNEKINLLEKINF